MHVNYMNRTWTVNLGVQPDQRPSFNEAYHSPEVRGTGNPASGHADSIPDGIPPHDLGRETSEWTAYAGGLTNAPQEGSIVIRPDSSASTRTALAAVARLTPYCSASFAADGSTSPGSHSPESRRSRSASATMR